MTSPMSHEQSVEAQYEAFTRAERSDRFAEAITNAERLEAFSYTPPSPTGKLTLNLNFNPNHRNSDTNPYWMWRATA